MSVQVGTSAKLQEQQMLNRIAALKTHKVHKKKNTCDGVFFSNLTGPDPDLQFY